nr:hypothetical protein [Pedobacter panaciterrae]
MIQLEKSYTDVSEISDLRKYNTEITKIWNITINNSKGNVITVGDNNLTTIQSTVF